MNERTGWETATGWWLGQVFDSRVRYQAALLEAGRLRYAETAELVIAPMRREIRRRVLARRAQEAAR